jgi:hypothetical protein
VSDAGRYSHRVFVQLDQGGVQRGFILDNAPVQCEVEQEAAAEPLRLVEFGPGLVVESLPIKAAALVGESAADAGSLSATLALDAFDVWSARADHPLQTITVRVWLALVDDTGLPVWEDGTDRPLSNAAEIFRGVLRDPAPDLDAGTLSFTAAPILRTVDIMFPPCAIEAERFPAAPEDSTANAVPIIYGTVQGLPLRAVSDVTALVIRLVVAGHPIVSLSLDIYRDGVVVDAGVPVLYDIDEMGGEYAYVEIAKVDYTAGSNLYARTVTGWRAPDGAAIDALGDVLLHLWRTYSDERYYELDLRRAEAARATLNRYSIGVYSDTQQADTGLIRILVSWIGGQFPVAFGASGGRFGWDATRIPTDVEIPGLTVGTLTYGLDAHDREGPAESSADEIVNRWEIHYGLDGYARGAVSVLRADWRTMGALRGSVSRWGESPIERVDCPAISTPDSAWSVLTDRARLKSVVRESVTYHALDGTWYAQPLFGVVLVTDARCGYDREPCLIVGLAPSLDGRVSMSLLRVRGV